jgi:hypothetical protein
MTLLHWLLIIVLGGIAILMVAGVLILIVNLVMIFRMWWSGWPFDHAPRWTRKDGWGK